MSSGDYSAESMSYKDKTTLIVETIRAILALRKNRIVKNVMIHSIILSQTETFFD